MCHKKLSVSLNCFERKYLKCQCVSFIVILNNWLSIPKVMLVKLLVPFGKYYMFSRQAQGRISIKETIQNFTSVIWSVRVKRIEYGTIILILLKTGLMQKDRSRDHVTKIQKRCIKLSKCSLQNMVNKLIRDKLNHDGCVVQSKLPDYKDHNKTNQWNSSWNLVQTHNLLVFM